MNNSKLIIGNLFFILHIFSNSITGQVGLQIEVNSILPLTGFQGAHILLFEEEQDYSRLRFTNSTFDASTNNRFWDIAARIGSENSFDLMNFYHRITGDILSIRGDGRVGIRTTVPDATLEVNGYTMMGSDAPAIKVKKMVIQTEETGATQCFDSGIPTNLNILSVSVHLVDSDPKFIIPANYGSGNTYVFDYFLNYSNNPGGTKICIQPDGSSTFNVNYNIMIVYEQP